MFHCLRCFLKSFVKVVQHLISSAANSTDRHQYFLKLCAIFSQPRLNKNIDFWCHVWLESAKVLLTVCENLTKNDKEFVNGDVLTFLMWIVIYLHFTSPTLEKVSSETEGSQMAYFWFAGNICHVFFDL